MTGTVRALARYPMKGFAGEALERVKLDVDAGVPGDRGRGLANGERDVGTGRSWTPCGAFVRLTTHPGLVLHCADDPDVARAFGRPLDAWVRRDGPRGLWDHEDAALSIVNLASLRSLERGLGRSLAIERFRANVVVDTGIAWSELAWTGRKVRLGGARVEVLRPTDRCRATSVDPDTGRTDVNVPRVLAALAGHVCFGVYARVVEAGEVRAGDAMSAEEPARGVRLAELVDASPATAPSPATWPRPVTVRATRRHAADVLELELADPLGVDAPASDGAPWLQLHLDDGDGPVSRSYTTWRLPGDAPGTHRIGVRRRPGGRVSATLHDGRAAPGATLLASGPFAHADAVPDARTAPSADGSIPARRPLVLLSAGIGVTVTLAALGELVASVGRGGSVRSVRVGHGVRGVEGFALREAFEKLVAACDEAGGQAGGDAVVTVFTGTATRSADGRARDELAGNDGAGRVRLRPGRVDPALVLDGLDPRAVDVVTCGPESFGAGMRRALRALGVPDERVREDVFVSPPDALAEPREPSASGPFDVTFEPSGRRTSWTASSGTLLELAEREGLDWPVNCRAGACGACLQPVRGPVEYLLDPVRPVREGAVLACCAVPAGPLRIGSAAS